MSQRIPGIFFMESDLGGLGVFAGEDIPKDSCIEICPIIILSKKDTKRITDTHLYDYYFIWGKKENKSAIALGYGSLYNHSYEPNATFESNNAFKTICIYSLREIKAGEEILVNYNGDGELARKELWFDVK